MSWGRLDLPTRLQSGALKRSSLRLGDLTPRTQREEELKPERGCEETMPTSDSSPDKHGLVERESSACSVDTMDSYSGKDGKPKEIRRHRGGDLRRLFSLPDTEVRHASRCFVASA